MGTAGTVPVKCRRRTETEYLIISSASSHVSLFRHREHVVKYYLSFLTVLAFERTRIRKPNTLTIDL